MGQRRMCDVEKNGKLYDQLLQSIDLPNLLST